MVGLVIRLFLAKWLQTAAFTTKLTNSINIHLAHRLAHFTSLHFTSLASLPPSLPPAPLKMRTISLHFARRRRSDRLNRVIEVEESEGSPRQFNDGYLASLPVLTEFLGKGSVLKNLVLPLVSDSGHAATVEIEGTEAWCNKSVGMAVMGFVIGCEEAGLGSCVMEGYDARRIREALNVPGGRAERRWGVPCVVAVGECGDERSFGSGNVVLTKRLDVDEVFFSGSFGVGYDCDVKE